MTRRIINEGLDYLDMVDQIEPTVSVDEYAAKMGKDSDIVTLAFIVNSEAAGNDLVDWFERGYDWILDASLSEGELSPGKYLVFVEMKRRTKVPERIVELVEDLETLTDLSTDDWTISIDEEDYDADVEALKQVIPISPHEYREENEDEEELNEMRKRAGLETVNLYGKPDSEIQAYIAMAGL
jgi:ABC-type Fe3+-hydroxamate transport system substrate-binding protein